MKLDRVIGIALAAGFCSLATATVAADAPASRPVVAQDWRGFYVGGHAGGAWASIDSVWDPLPSSAAFATFPYSRSFSDTGFIGGALAGYNWQVQQWVFGVEADWSSTSLRSSSSQPWISNPGGGVSPNASTTLAFDVNWMATLRGRMGFLWNPQTLVYATGGAAWADINYQASSVNPGTYGASTAFSDTVSGWVIGGGVEWLWSNWTVRVEYLYHDLSSGKSVIAPDATGNFPGFPSNFRWSDMEVQTVRAGLSYKFDWSKASAVSK
jgi:outer membrane immunogenic protein